MATACFGSFPAFISVLILAFRAALLEDFLSGICYLFRGVADMVNS